MVAKRHELPLVVQLFTMSCLLNLREVRLRKRPSKKAVTKAVVKLKKKASLTSSSSN